MQIELQRRFAVKIKCCYLSKKFQMVKHSEVVTDCLFLSGPSFPGAFWMHVIVFWPNPSETETDVQRLSDFSLLCSSDRWLNIGM